MTYVYSPLQGDCIRLFSFGCTDTGEIVGKLEVRSLRSCAGQYTAISYAWESEERVQICDGGFLNLSKSLGDLFNSLPRQKEHLLWIDAVCINQGDVSERQSQVAMMGEIYTLASSVLVWLGADTALSRAAFQAMNSRKNYDWPEDWDNENSRILSDSLESLFLFLETTWFRRTWVMQEYALNSTVEIMCGEDSVDSITLHTSICAIWRYFQRLGDYDRDHPAVRGLWNMNRMLFVRRDLHYLGNMPFERLLEAAHHCEASNERDKIYGLLGLGNLPLTISYEISPEAVFQQAAEACLCFGKSLDLLSLSGISRRTQLSALPTWVPDPRNRCHEEPITAASRGNYNAGQIERGVVTRAKKLSDNHLVLRAQRIDVITATFIPLNFRSVRLQRAAMRQILSQRSKLKREVSDIELFEYLMKTMTFGLNLDDEIIGPEYLRYFVEWLEWLQSSTTEADLDRIKHNRFYRTVNTNLKPNGWKFCLSQGGYLCMGPSLVQVGDTVYCLPGCCLPLILRQTKSVACVGALEDKRSLPMQLVVSWCYFQGLMQPQSSVTREMEADIVLG